MIKTSHFFRRETEAISAVICNSPCRFSAKLRYLPDELQADMLVLCDPS